jgi:O-acetyl-ADP-ribose deacetylase (regulator of RNase III)
MKIQYELSVKQGNVVEENADFIVNASNTTLRLGSGVSMCFAKHCGKSLQAEMTQLFNQLSESDQLLHKGDVVVTGPGEATNFKHAVHVATIDYNRGVHRTKTRPTLPDIEQALEHIESVLIEYSTKHQISQVRIATPLLGCGVGGLDKDEVMKCYLDFCNQNQDLACDVKCEFIVYTL